MKKEERESVVVTESAAPAKPPPPATDSPGQDAKAVLWPIAKRMPRYARLAFELAREPAIPARYKAGLYATVVYQVTPIHLVVTPIPIIGQVDTIVLLLLSIRQILAHCPEDVARRHFAKLRLPRQQIDRDVDAVLRLSGEAVAKAQRKIKKDLRFVGRFAAGLGRRQINRLVSASQKPKASARPQRPVRLLVAPE
jgi:uncharacterized membrane protein YkvA (DUF1232 family)